jgi:four helix bundle protein
MEKFDILDRCVNYSLEAIEVYRDLEKDTTGRVMGRQFLRSSTSVGANMNEAQAAQSRADFVSRLQISLKEVKETGYWIKLIEGSKMLPSGRIKKVKDETEELAKIIAAIIIKTKKMICKNN